ncbi:hypothetical protein VTI74DRAFT_276 [Chaetomium olivicolor]
MIDLINAIYTVGGIITGWLLSGSTSPNLITYTKNKGSYEAGSLDASATFNILSSNFRAYNSSFRNTCGTQRQSGPWPPTATSKATTRVTPTVTSTRSRPRAVANVDFIFRAALDVELIWINGNRPVDDL